MTRITRRGFATLGAATVLGCALPLRYAKAAEFTFKLGTNVPETHPLNIYLRKASTQIAEQTNGRFDLQLFPNNQLGGDSDMFSQLRSGALESFMLSGVNVLSTLIPSASIYGLGFAFKDYQALWSALDGKLGDKVRAAEAYAQAYFLRGKYEDAMRQLEQTAARNDLDYYERARIDAQVAEWQPIVLRERRRAEEDERG